jgi:hypothetical protein
MCWGVDAVDCKRVHTDGVKCMQQRYQVVGMKCCALHLVSGYALAELPITTAVMVTPAMHVGSIAV